MTTRRKELFLSLIPLFLALWLERGKGGIFYAVGGLFFSFSYLWGWLGLVFSIASYMLIEGLSSNQEWLFFLIAGISGLISFLLQAPSLPEKNEVETQEEELPAMQEIEEDPCQMSLILNLQEQQKKIVELEQEILLLEELVTTIGFVAKPPVRRRQNEEKGQIFFPLEIFSIASSRE